MFYWKYFFSIVMRSWQSSVCPFILGSASPHFPDFLPHTGDKTAYPPILAPPSLS